jgi:ribosomal protein S18 acetylase RimI-like enzyme
MIRQLQPLEYGRIKEALLRTARWREVEPTVALDELLLLVPRLRHYYQDFGREGDKAILIEVEGALAGIAWYRLFTQDAPGFGFTDEKVPELGIAVWPAFRGQGLGATLLDALIEQAIKEGHTALSLCVGEENAAARNLYLSRRFEETSREGRALVMVRSLP